jgi:hypothetical protein
VGPGVLGSLLGSLLGLASCGGGSDRPLPDAGHDLTIALFRHVPFADGDTQNAQLVAIQDGDAPWTALTGEQGVYRVRLASDRYGVAIGCRTGDASRVSVFQRTVADGLVLRTRSCAAEAVALDVVVQSVPASSSAYISARGGAAGGGALTYSFALQPGPAELFASLADSTQRTVKLVRESTFDLQAPHQITIDFASEGAAPEEHALQIGALGDQARVISSVIRPTGEYALHGPRRLGTSASYQTLPAALRRPDDLFGVTISVGGISTTLTSRSPGMLAFDLPEEINAPAPSVLATPFLHPVFTFEATATDLAIQTYLLSAHTSGASESVTHDWHAELTASWVGAGPSVRYEFPDLTAVTGFSPELALFDRGPVRWSVQRIEASSATDGDGRIVRSAVQAGAIESYCGDHIVEPPETCDPPDGTTCSETCTKL